MVVFVFAKGISVPVHISIEENNQSICTTNGHVRKGGILGQW